MSLCDKEFNLLALADDLNFLYSLRKHFMLACAGLDLPKHGEPAYPVASWGDAWGEAWSTDGHVPNGKSLTPGA